MPCGPTGRANCKTVLFIDEANCYDGERRAGWRIDWQKLLCHFQSAFDLHAARFYEGTPTDSVIRHQAPGITYLELKERKNAKRKRFDTIRGFGFIVRTKPVGSVYDSRLGRYKHKCNFDVEITLDALATIDEYDAFVLVSGDGDFAPLIRYLNSKGRHTVVVSFPDRVSHKLRDAAHEFVSLEGIRSHVERIWARH
jgi:uncharacterized LabA/DUF88 family protein